VFGINQTETTEFIEQTRPHAAAPFAAGEVVDGGTTRVYAAPNAASIFGSSVFEAAESIVALGGAAAAQCIASAVAASDRLTRRTEDALLAGLDLYGGAEGGPAAAVALSEAITERRRFVDAAVTDLERRSEANFWLNPLVSSWTGDLRENAVERAGSDHYIFNAPRTLYGEAMRSEGREKTALIATAIAAQASLDFLTGILAFGPMGSALGPGAHVAYQRGMQAMMFLGAMEATVGEEGLAASMHRYRLDPSPEHEAALYEALSLFSSLTIPYLVGGMAAMRGGAPRRAPGVAPRGLGSA
jgi:hypothetical protein